MARSAAGSQNTHTPMNPTCSTIGQAPHTFDAPTRCSCGRITEGEDLCDECQIDEDSIVLTAAEMNALVVAANFDHF